MLTEVTDIQDPRDIKEIEVAPPLNEKVLERIAVSKELKKHGLAVIELDNILPESSEAKRKTFFIAGDESRHLSQKFSWADFSKIEAAMEDNYLSHSQKTSLQEILAGISPFIGVIPIETQQEFEKALETTILKPGYRAAMQGVVPQENYSRGLLPFGDLTGIGKASLDYPTIRIDVYNEKDEFVETIQLVYLDKQQEQRLVDIKTRANQNPNFKEEFSEIVNEVFDLFYKDGLTDRPIEDNASIGHMATRRGLTWMDCAELCLDYPNMKSWLENLDPFDKELNLSADQRRTLAAKKLRASEGRDPYEVIHPTELEVITEAISYAEGMLMLESIDDPEVISGHLQTIEGLKKYKEQILQGRQRMLHNIVRHDQWELNRIKEEDNFGKLREILRSRFIKPRAGTFTKGTYFARANIGTDDVSILPTIFKEAGDRVFILELDGNKDMEAFKHEGCVVTNRPQSLSKLRRIIVNTEDIDETRAILDAEGYTDVDVVPYEIWQQEMVCIEAAQASLIKV